MIFNCDFQLLNINLYQQHEAIDRNFQICKQKVHQLVNFIYLVLLDNNVNESCITYYTTYAQFINYNKFNIIN